MAKERVFTYRNVGTAEEPVWEKWFQKTVADAVLMSDGDEEEKTIVDYVNSKIDGLIGGAPGTYDTLKEIADYIESHEDVAESLNQAIANKADKSHTHAAATQAADGFMSGADKKKLDGVAAGANKTVVDAALSDSSTNPVQNRAVKAELDKKVNLSLKGAKNGLAELDAGGKVPSSQLPSYVDDVVEGYLSGGKFYKESAHTTEIAGEAGKIYVDLPKNKTYRWSGSAFTEISASLALGETSSTAFRGDYGKAAYAHSQSAHAPANAQKNVQSDWNESDSGSDAYIKNKPSKLPADGGDADTVGGHTVKTDVPEGAVFTDTKPVVMKGATSEAAGAAGYAPAPAKGAQGKYLRGDGTWQTPPNTTYSEATQSKAGLMSAADKKKVDTMPQIIFAAELPESAPAGSVCFLIG